MLYSRPKNLSRPEKSRTSLWTYFLIWTMALLLMVQDAEAGDGPGGGRLTLSTAGGVVAVPALHTSVRLDISGPLIRAELRQEFVNPTDQTIEAQYVFPLPDRATVSAMEMLIGERRIVSVVQEKQQARRTYRQARDSGRRAALVEQARPNLFSAEAANIGPGEKVIVRLEYLDQVSYEDGWFALVVPLTLTPRYLPRAGGGELGTPPTPVANDAWRVQPPFRRGDDRHFPHASIDVRLQPGLELAELNSPSHTVSTRQNDTLWSVAPQSETVPADRDFLLRWRPVTAPLARPALFVEDRPEGRYALLMVVPGVDGEDAFAATPRPSTETLYVVDVSGSMDGPSLRQAQQALTTALKELAPGDRFNILAFNNSSWFWKPDFQAVSSASLNGARHWVQDLRADGGTEMHPALLQAQTAFLAPVAGDRARRIVLLTDAAVGNEDQLLRESIVRLGDIRLHVVGIGMAPNRYLVRRLAGQGGGLSTFVSGHADDTSRLIAFLARIARPQLVDPHLEWTGSPPVEGYPARLGEPFSGALTLWSGRFPVDTDLEGFLRARWADQNVALPLGADATVTTGGVAARWANLKVDDLLAAFDGGGNRESLRAEIVRTGLTFGLVTRFTSRVAVEQVVLSEGPTATHRIANSLPAGSTLLGELPQGGTLAQLWRALGLVLLLTGWAGWRARTARRTGRGPC
jgi:Ca-activated chloride channel family protein